MLIVGATGGGATGSLLASALASSGVRGGSIWEHSSSHGRMTTRVGSLSGGSVGGAAIDLGAQVISPDARSASRVAELVAAGLLAPVAPGAILGVREGAGVTHAAPGGVSGVERHC